MYKQTINPTQADIYKILWKGSREILIGVHIFKFNLGQLRGIICMHAFERESIFW